MHLNAAMKLKVVPMLWMHADGPLGTHVLMDPQSEALLLWLMEKEAKLVWEMDTLHDMHTQCTCIHMGFFICCCC